MSTFGPNNIIKSNPVFQNNLADPAHIAAGEVLEENGVRTSEQVTDGGLKMGAKIPLGLKIIVFLLFLIAVVALVFTMLMYSGKITPQTSNPDSSNQAKNHQVGFGLSNQELKQQIENLQKQVDQIKNMSKIDDNALEEKLQKSINNTIDKCMNVNTTLIVKVDAVSKMEGPIGPRGYNGSQGIQGIKGDTGAKGETGPPGVPGAKGETGAAGAQGVKGDTGAKGETGPKGQKGEIPAP
ncbi:Collagen alpha-1(VI) chain [Exaiptasia diaphana]|nr:Collagen alpha-1(VI) chain [Exaiptasia diaphana]